MAGFGYLVENAFVVAVGDAEVVGVIEAEEELELTDPIFLNILSRLEPPQISHWLPVQDMLQSDLFAGTEPAEIVEPQ